MNIKENGIKTVQNGKVSVRLNYLMVQYMKGLLLIKNHMAKVK